MKHAQILMSILALSGAISARADDAIPKRSDFSRYSAMVNRSPFAVASAPVPGSTKPPWSKDLFIANAAHTPEVDLVTIMSLSDKNLKQYLSTEGPNKDGYGIANIEWSDSPGATKVTISKDAQFATIGFNEALLSQPPSPIMGAAGNMPSGSRPAPAPPVPHVRGVIQRNPPQNPPPQSAPAQAPPES
jgi:hypothetical protein